MAERASRNRHRPRYARRGAVAVAPVVAVLVLTGCGSSTPAAPSAAAGSSTPASTGAGSAPHASSTNGPDSTTVPSRATRTGPPAPPGPATAAPVESNPPGDIPDNVAYVSYTNAAGRYSFTHPEGWLSGGSGPDVSFTDKLNGITVQSVPGGAAPSVAAARSHDVPVLQRGQSAFELRSVTGVVLPAGPAVLILYRRNSTPDPVTGRVFRDDVQRYELLGHGRRLALELYGAVGSDNVDPYTKISQSLRLR